MQPDAIKFRAPELSDLEMLMEIENNPKYLDIGPVTSYYSRFQMERFIRQSKNDLYIDHSIRWIIEYEGKLVGIADIFHFDSRHSRAELGIYIRPSMRRKGFALAALNFIESECFVRLDIHQLYVRVLADNIPSLMLFEQAGYSCSGRLKDWIKVSGQYRDVWMLQKIRV